MKHILLIVLSLFSSRVVISQNVFQVYDNYTLKTVDSLTISIDNKKATVRKLSDGLFIVEDGKNGDKVMIKHPDYNGFTLNLEKGKKSSETIMLRPTKSKLKEYKSNLPYYQEYTLSDINRDFPDSIINHLDSSAVFPGGINLLYDYLRNNIEYPQIGRELDIEGKVIIQFIVEADGSITTCHIIKSVNQPMDAEAYRVVQTMPKWIPATYKGVPTKCIFNLPVSFQLR